MKANRSFKVIYNINPNENDGNVSEKNHVHIDWGGQSKIPLSSHPAKILKKIAYRLFIGSPDIGGNIIPDYVTHVYSEIKLDVYSIRLYPIYSNMGCWYDWAYFR